MGLGLGVLSYQEGIQIDVGRSCNQPMKGGLQWALVCGQEQLIGRVQVSLTL